MKQYYLPNKEFKNDCLKKVKQASIQWKHNKKKSEKQWRIKVRKLAEIEIMFLKNQAEIPKLKMQ
jgi:hypothetical protein